MSTFATMKTNVGNAIQDTSTDTASLIGVCLNRRYFQVLRKINWNYINEDYLITTAAGTQNYTLASDFGKELYVWDSTNGKNISKVDLEGLAKHYPTTLESTGTAERYAIYNSDSGAKFIRFHYTPSTISQMKIPYIVNPSAMSATSDTPVIDISDLIELGAIADMMRYKRKWQQAREYDTQFQISLDDHIWSKYNQPNKVYQFQPNTFNRDDLV